MKNNFPTKNSLSFQTKKLFNLGLHLNKKTTLNSWNNYTYTREKNNCLVYHPLHLTRQLNLITRLITKLVRSGGRIVLINNGAEFRKNIVSEFMSLFEGLEILCFEEDWLPGTFTNPIHGYAIPDLIIYLSSNEHDRQLIFSEVRSLKIPFLNFSNLDYQHNLVFNQLTSNPTKVYFFLHLLLHWIHKQNIKELNPQDPFDEGGENIQTTKELLNLLPYKQTVNLAKRKPKDRTSRNKLFLNRD
jgi:hypothetical protein